MMSVMFTRYLKIYIVIAAVSLFATLWLPYVGEEGVYTITAYEMWYHHHYLVNTLYGDFYGRPPLLNWFIIPLAKWWGWSQVLVASRFVSAMATVLVTLTTYKLSQRLTRNNDYALLSAAFYLTGDLLFVRGWLAYADPLLSLFIFGAIAGLWLAVDEQRFRWLLIATAALSGGFLVKALSPYWFYGLAGLVLLILHPNRKFLLRPQSIAIHLLALAIPFVWHYYADPRYLPTMWHEAINTAFAPGLKKYLYQIVVTQPGMLMVNLAPMSLIALYYCIVAWKQKSKIGDDGLEKVARIAFWIALLNFAICWFAPRWPEPRYYMPVYPLMAMCLAYVMYGVSLRSKVAIRYGLLVALIAKVVFVGYFYIRYQYKELDNAATAKDILRIVGDASLAVEKTATEVAPVERVAIYVDLKRYPKPPLITVFGVEQKKGLTYNFQSTHQCQGLYVIGQAPTRYDTLVKAYSQGKRLVSLLCRNPQNAMVKHD